VSVTIRLKRAGARHRPFFKVVVTDSRMPRDGRFIATLGTYDPLAESGNINIDLERVKEWMGKGAKPSDTVTQLLRKAGLAPERPVVTRVAPRAVSLDELRSAEAESPAAPSPAVSEGEAEETRYVRKKPAAEKAPRAAKRTAKKETPE
jgi:small subunit ribosomal protein S16